MKKRLNQVIAAEAEAKGSTQRNVTGLLRLIQNPAVFGGMTKGYTPLDENGEHLPPDTKRVQARVPEVLGQVKDAWADQMGLTLQKDRGNCEAFADVTVDGEVLLKDAPVTFLLFLEKRVMDFATVAASLPTLDDAYDWDMKGDLWKTPSTKTHRTKKVQKPLVLHPPTDKHPAQTQMITEDEVVGHYETVHFSGALPRKDKMALQRRCSKLLRAVREAREQANMVEAPVGDVEALLTFIFN